MKIKSIIIKTAAVSAWIGVIALLVGCTTLQANAPTTPVPSDSNDSMIPAGRLTVMTHDSFAISERVLNEFQTQNNAEVIFLKSGDTGTALNKAILAKNHPLADVFYGVDNTFMSRALAEGIFESYDSPVLDSIPDTFEYDPGHAALPVNYADVCLNYDVASLNDLGIEPPNSLDDLVLPEYKSLLVVENPATSSPGLAFLLATIGRFGEEGFLDYWGKLVENDLLVVNGWESAYYTEFSGAAGKGPRPLVVSYNSSPVYEVLFAETPPAAPPTAAITAPDTCFRQVEFVGVLKGTKNPELARKWIDFMLSVSFQEDMPGQMFVLPVNQNAWLDDNFSRLLQIPEKTIQIDPERIAMQRELWIKEWTEKVLR